MTKSFQRILMIGLIVVMISLLAITSVFAQGPNLVQNGSFEDGFVIGLGVANDWEYFQSSNVNAGFYDDTWNLVVSDGEHAQLIKLIDATSTDSYGGIYQNVAVTAGEAYQLSFDGLVRSNEGSVEASGWGYRMQYAIDQTGNTNWQAVTDWVELPWDDQPRLGPDGETYTINSMTDTFTADGDNVTIFIRAWKKWAGNHEGNFDIDNVQLIAVDAATITTDDNADTTEDTEIVETTDTDTTDAKLPETGGVQNSTTNTGTVALFGSIALLVALLGGAILNQKRAQKM